MSRLGSEPRGGKAVAASVTIAVQPRGRRPPRFALFHLAHLARLRESRQRARTVRAVSVDWETCSEDGCIGRGHTLTGDASRIFDPDDFETALEQIARDGKIDACGVEFHNELLHRILDALRATPDGSPRFEQADFRSATFKGDARFDGVTFKEAAWFSEAAFEGGARFSDPTFDESAWFDGVLFRQDAVFSKATFKGVAHSRGSRGLRD
jgi:uncharacterized protein YjbI with pentapeptide repeats